VVLGVLAGGALGQTKLHVDDNAAAGGNGLSWNSPFQNPQEALAFAANNPGSFEIYVAEGVYKPGDTLSPLTVTFTIPPDTNMFGGFVGVVAETDPSFRQGDPELTILSGNLDNAPGYAGNAYHVVTVGPGVTNLTFDGFHIRFGNAQDEGGGMLIKRDSSTSFDRIDIDHCIFTKNRALQGGGLAAIWGDGLVLRYCTFRDNEATSSLGEGGAVYLAHVNGDDPDTSLYSGAAIFNTLFDGNSADIYGGAISLSDSFARMMNCVMYDNVAGSYGGACYMGLNVGAEFVNCTIAYNTASGNGPVQALGGGLYFQPSWTDAFAVRNCILWNNLAQDPGGLTAVDSLNGPEVGLVIVRRSDVETWSPLPPPNQPWPGGGNILADPLFRNGPARDLTLNTTSPCIDAGKDDHIFDDWGDLNENGVTLGERTMYDFTQGQAREVDFGATGGPGKDSGPAGIVDMGAHERQNQP
jgi:Chlamydia polymorphic membrane protein (Chlamydia_PMP) repeat